MAGYVGIPTLLVTTPGLTALLALAQTQTRDGDGDDADTATVVITLKPLLPQQEQFQLMNHWIDLAHTEWQRAPRDQVQQVDGLVQRFLATPHCSGDIIDWLHRRRSRVSGDNETFVINTQPLFSN